MQMLYTKNRMLMVLALVGLMLFFAIPAAIAQINLNGNVENDFNPTYSIRIADNTGPQPDVAVPGNFPLGTITGWEMSEVRFYYDADTDRLYVGINSVGIVGDVDGNGDPATARPELITNAGTEMADLGNGEMVSVYLDIDQDGTYDLNAGVSQTADYSGFTVSRFSGSPSNPGQAFGAAVPYHQGSVSPNPSAASPDLEFYIAHFSEVATTLGLTDANPLEFSMNAFMGSGVDDGIGEDFLRLTPVSVELAEIGDYVWDELTVNGLQDAGEPAIPNVTVELYRTDGTLEATTTTDASGLYRFRVNPGDYYLKFIPIANRIFACCNQGGDNSNDSDPNFETGITETTTLSAGEIDLTWDAGMVRPVEFHGLLWEDLDADGIQDTGETGRAGETVILYCVAGDSTFRTTTTDANGEYSFTGIPPQSFRIEFELPTGAKAFSPQDEGSDNTVDSDADLTTGRSIQYDTSPGDVNNNIDAGFYFPATIGNRVWLDLDADGVQDAGESGLTPITIELRNSIGTVISTTSTDGSGLYGFSDLTPGTYSLQYQPAGFSVSPQDQDGNDAADSDFNPTTLVTITTELVSNENDDSWDLGLYSPITIGDFVFEDLNANGVYDAGDQPISGATVTLLNSDGSSTGLSKTTDASGNYLFAHSDNVAPGSYIVEFTTPTGFMPTLQNQGDDALDSDADPVTGRSQVVTLTSGNSDLTIDAGFVKPASVGDFIWNDLNFNGAQDFGEPGVEGVTVYLLNQAGTVKLDSINTTSTGFYSFTDLFPGIYQIEVELPATALSFTERNAAGVIPADNSDVIVASGRSAVSLSQDMDYIDLDAGILYTGQIGDHVWLDRDRDGIFDSGEEPIENVTVNLLDSAGTQISLMQTDIHGYYLFQDLDPAKYSVNFEIPAYYALTTQDVGGDDALDSDPDATTGTTAPYIISSNEVDLTADAGFYLLDTDNDSIPDIDEVPGDRDGDGVLNEYDFDPQGWIYSWHSGHLITGSTVTVTGPDVSVVHAGADGYYQFYPGLTGGTYTIAITPPEGWEVSIYCDAQTGTLDPAPGASNPLMLGAGRDGATDYMTDYTCANNTYFWTMTLEPGDPIIINNNIPLMRHRPIPDFVADSTWGVNNLCVEFTNLTQYGDSYVWDFGDGTTYATTNNEEPVTHCYNSGKKHYTVSLTSTNETGTVTETKEDYIEVSRSIDLGFNATPLGGVPGTAIQFTNESGGNISHFLWNFGDGITEGYRHSTLAAEKVHPAHNYDEAGKYSVALSAWGRGGIDTLQIADLITIDPDYLELALADSSVTVPGYGWSHAIDQDIVSTNCKVLAPNNQPWATFMFPDGAKRAVERVRLMVNTLAGDNYPTHLASEVEVWASMNGADFNFVTEAVIKNADAWVEIGFEPILATHVKLVLKKAQKTTAPAITISEFQVFGKPASAMMLLKGIGQLIQLNGERVTDYELAQNYPNPFNPSTMISFALPENGNVSLKIFNIKGQEVMTVFNKQLVSGRYKVDFNAGAMASGVYFYQLKTAGFRQSKQMTFIK